MLNKKSIEAARKRIEAYLPPTPLEKSTCFCNDDTKMYMKLECSQTVARSYKIRGVVSKITSLTEEERKQGVTAISSGNHGAALSYGANALGVDKVEVYVPTTTPNSKVEKIKKYGAKVNLVAETFDETYRLASEDIEKKGLIKVDPRDDEVCVMGHGTIAMEILEQLPETDVILVPVGSGALVTGIGVYAKQINKDIEVYGIQPEVNPSMLDSIKEKKWYKSYPIKGESTCDAIVGGISKFAYENAGDWIDGILLVNEEETRQAVKEMVLNEKIVAESSSAITYAAYKRYNEMFQNKNTVLVVTGSNIDAGLLEKFITEN